MKTANIAMARVTAARAQAQKESVETKTVFFGLAEARSGEGQKKLLGQKSYLMHEAHLSFRRNDQDEHGERKRRRPTQILH